jgi:paraquat-inducible protein B
MKTQGANPVRIGIFVIGGLVILAAAVVFLGSGRLFQRTHALVSYFDGSVNGLRAGASVKFKGVEVGTVDRIRIPGGLMQTDRPIAVFFEIDGDELEALTGGSESWTDLFDQAIENGLRAQLESDSLVTGVQHVSLVFEPDSELNLHEPIEGAMEIPTIPPPLQEIGIALRSIVDRVGRYDFEGLLDGLKGALEGVSDISRAPELRSSIASLDATLKEARAAIAKLGAQVDPVAGRLVAVAERADAVGADLQAGIGAARETMASVKTLADKTTASVVPLTESLKEASEKLQATATAMQAALASTQELLDPEAPLAVELRNGLRDVSDAARSTRALVELLERDPAAILRGKGSPEERR